MELDYDHDAVLIDTEQVPKEDRKRNIDAQDDFVIIEKEEALHCFVSYVIECLNKSPDFNKTDLSPKEWQSLYKNAVRSKKGRMRRFFNSCRTMYRFSVITYGTVSLYQNIWVGRAALFFVWAALRISTSLPLPRPMECLGLVSKTTKSNPLKKMKPG